jgi:hypothetical protein
MSPERLPKVSPFLPPEQEEDKHSDLFIVRAVLLILSSALFLFVFAAGGKLIYEVLLAENPVPNPHVLVRLFLISLVYVRGTWFYCGNGDYRSVDDAALRDFFRFATPRG